MKTACRLAFLLLCTMVMLSQVHAQIAISPPMTDISLDGPSQTHSFRLMNSFKTPVHIKVSVENWAMDDQGRVIPAATTEQSLDSWVELNPSEFTVLPGQSQVVRYAIRPAVVLSPGEHRAMVFFTQQAMPGEKPKAGTLKVYFRFGAAVYAHVGPVHESGELTSFKADAHAAVFGLHNTGNATTRLRGQYAIWTVGTKPAGVAATSTGQLATNYKPPSGLVRYGRLPQDAVLPDASRAITLDLARPPLAPGHYVMSVQGTLGVTDVTRELRFDVTAGSQH